MKKNKLLLLFSLIPLLGYGQGFAEIQKISADDRDVDDRFGWCVDISGNYAIVGAYGDDFGGSNPNMGSAYIYEKNETGDWIFVQKIFNSDQDDYDRFGWSVAIHNNRAVVGAYAEDEDVNDENTLAKAGSVYVFERNADGVWEEMQKIVASDRAAEDEFGFSVDIHDDLIVVGAHYCSTNATGGSFSRHAGAAYIYELNDADIWAEKQKIVASDRFGNPGLEYDEEDWNWRYGESVGVYEDYVVVGSPFAAKGYVYERSGETWNEADLLEYPGIAWLDRAGIVSIHETTVILGAQTWDYSEEFGDDELMNAGGAAIFDRDGTGNWNFTQMIVGSDRSAGDHFGIDAYIEGDLIVCGAHQDNHDADGEEDLSNAGSAYIFKKTGESWTEYAKVDASDRNAEDELGIAVSVSGTTVLIGAFQQDFPAGGGTAVSDAGAAYFYLDNDDADCPTVYSSQHLSICEGESVTVGESVYTNSGTYSDVLTSVEGCDSIVTTYLNVITDEPYTNEVTICNGGSVEVGESVYTEAGTYTDIFTTEAGCDSIVETTVIVTDEIPDNEIFVDDFGLFSTAVDAVGFQWIHCDPYGIIDGETSPFYIPTEDGYYAVIITNTDGCVDTSDCVLWGDEPIDDSGLEDLFLNGQISIYPNPSRGTFNVMLNGTQEEVKLEVISDLGQVLYQKPLQKGQNTVELQNVSVGVYLIRMYNGTDYAYRRLIIQ